VGEDEAAYLEAAAGFIRQLQQEGKAEPLTITVDEADAQVLVYVG
jgi:hypothetical protein